MARLAKRQVPVVEAVRGHELMRRFLRLTAQSPWLNRRFLWLTSPASLVEDAEVLAPFWNRNGSVCGVAHQRGGPDVSLMVFRGCNRRDTDLDQLTGGICPAKHHVDRSLRTRPL